MSIRFRPEPRPLEQVANVVVYPPDGSAARTGRLSASNHGVHLTIGPPDGTPEPPVPMGWSAGSLIPEFDARGYDVALDLVPSDDGDVQAIAEAIYDQWWRACQRAVAEDERIAAWRRQQEAERKRLEAEMAEAAARARQDVCGHRPPGREGVACERSRDHFGLHLVTINDGHGFTRQVSFDDDGRTPPRPDSAPASDFVTSVADTTCGHVGPHGGRKCTLERGHEHEHGCNMIGGGIAAWLRWPTEPAEPAPEG